MDGEALNDLTLYGGVEDGRAIRREGDRRNRPLPRFSSTMLLTDIPTLLENSYRAGRSITLFATEAVDPVTFAGQNGVRFRYTFTGGDEVRRRGEAYGVIVRGRLYLATFEAPALHYFEASIEDFRGLVATAILREGR